MFAAAATNKPGRETTNRVMTGTLVARSVLNVAELALQGCRGQRVPSHHGARTPVP
jgi:hypothetical protein